MSNTVLSRRVRALPRLGASLTVTAAVAAALVLPASATARKSTAKTVNGGTVTVAFTPAVWAALTQSKGLTTRSGTAVAPATMTTPGSLVLPIKSGKLNPSSGAGNVTTTGGIDLSRTSNLVLFTSGVEGKLMNWRFTVSGSSKLMLDFVGSSTTHNVPFATLGTAFKHSKHGRTISLSGIKVTLTQTGAQLLNNFNSGFKKGQRIATVSVSATT